MPFIKSSVINHKQVWGETQTSYQNRQSWIVQDRNRKLGIWLQKPWCGFRRVLKSDPKAKSVKTWLLESFMKHFLNKSEGFSSSETGQFWPKRIKWNDRSIENSEYATQTAPPQYWDHPRGKKLLPIFSVILANNASTGIFPMRIKFNEH